MHAGQLLQPRTTGSSLSPAGMDEGSEPLRLDRHCIVVQSAPKSGRIPSHLISTLPYLQDIPRDLCINAQRSLLRSYCILRWLRGELDDEQAAIVEERLGDKGGAGSPLVMYPAALCSQSPMPSQDSDVEMGCSALLALREAENQAMEVDVQRLGVIVVLTLLTKLLMCMHTVQGCYWLHL